MTPAPRAKRRNVVKWRRKSLGGGRYLLIAVTDEPGPRGGHTVSQVMSRKGKNVPPAVVVEPSRSSRRVVIRRKPSSSGGR